MSPALLRVHALRLASAAALLLAACGTEASPAPSGARCDGVEILVAGRDRGSSVVCGAPVCALGPGNAGKDLGDDPQLTTSHGRAFFLARTSDTIFEIDPSCGFATKSYFVSEVARSAGFAGAANPHDIAAAPNGDLWVALYNVPYIAVLDGKDGSLRAKIDLSSYDYDADGNPQAEAIRIVEIDGRAKAFVALERLDDRDLLRSKQDSLVVRFDVDTRTEEARVTLDGRNPFNTMAEADGALFMAMPGNFDAANEPRAGVERFDVRAGTTALVVREEALGGSVAEIAVTGGCAAAIVAGPEKDVNPTSLVTFDPRSGRVWTTATAPLLGPTPGYDLQGLAWRGGTLYVGDRRRTATGYAVHVFERTSTEGCELRRVGRELTVPLPPVALRPSTSAPQGTP